MHACWLTVGLSAVQVAGAIPIWIGIAPAQIKRESTPVHRASFIYTSGPDIINASELYIFVCYINLLKSPRSQHDQHHALPIELRRFHLNYGFITRREEMDEWIRYGN